MSGGYYPPGTVEILDPTSPASLYGDPRYPGRGYPPRPGEDRPALSPWGRLSRGGAMGKKANLVFRAGGPVDQRATVSILQIEGDDADAKQVIVTLDSPRVVAQPFSSLLAQNSANVTGEQDNAQIASRTTFPGTLAPIQWPPFEAVIEWGVGGTSSRAVVDFVNGATLSLVTSWLRVSAAVVSGVAAEISGTSAVYTLAAFVGPGFGPSCAHKTVYAGNVAAGAESAVFAVPPFARYASVIVSDGAAAPAVAAATLRFWQSPDGVVSGHNVGNFVIAGGQPLPFPVPPGGAYASVRSGMNVGTRIAILYTLAL